MKYNNRNHIYYALHWGPAQGCHASAQWTYSVVGNDSVRFQGPAMVDGVNYGWDFGDGIIATATTDIIHHYAFLGNYTVCLRAYQADTTGCADSLCRAITVLGTCPTNAAWTKTVLSADSVHFIAPDTIYATTHIWNFGDSTTASGGNQHHPCFSGPGTYTVCYYSYIPGSACADTLCQAVTVTDPYSCVINNNWNYNFVGANDVAFQAADTTPQSHLSWTFGDGTTAEGAAPCAYIYPPG